MTALFNNQRKRENASPQDAQIIVDQVKTSFKRGYGKRYKDEECLRTWRFYQPKTQALFEKVAEEAMRLILQAAYARGEAPRVFAQQVIALLQKAAQQSAERQSVLAQAMNEVGSVLATRLEVETSDSISEMVVSGSGPRLEF